MEHSAPNLLIAKTHGQFGNIQKNKLDSNSYTYCCWENHNMFRTQKGHLWC